MNEKDILQQRNDYLKMVLEMIRGEYSPVKINESEISHIDSSVDTDDVFKHIATLEITIQLSYGVAGAVVKLSRFVNLRTFRGFRSIASDRISGEEYRTFIDIMDL